MAIPFRGFLGLASGLLCVACGISQNTPSNSVAIFRYTNVEALSYSDKLTLPGLERDGVAFQLMPLPSAQCAVPVYEAISAGGSHFATTRPGDSRTASPRRMGYCCKDLGNASVSLFQMRHRETGELRLVSGGESAVLTPQGYELELTPSPCFAPL